MLLLKSHIQMHAPCNLGGNQRKHISGFHQNNSMTKEFHLFFVTTHSMIISVSSQAVLYNVDITCNLYPISSKNKHHYTIRIMTTNWVWVMTGINDSAWWNMTMTSSYAVKLKKKLRFVIEILSSHLVSEVTLTNHTAHNFPSR